MKIEKLPAELEPFRISISQTRRANGDVEYHVSTMANHGSRPKQESWGFAAPLCDHLVCRWANMSKAAWDWARLIVPHQGLSVWHSEQLGVDYPLP